MAMQNKVSTLITVSNTLFIVVMCIVWWNHNQKQKQKTWMPVKSAGHTEQIACGEKKLVYTNGNGKEEQVGFTFTNNCTQPANVWIGQGDSVLIAGSSVIITRGQKITSTYALKPGESLVAESIGDGDSSTSNCIISYRKQAER